MGRIIIKPLKTIEDLKLNIGKKENIKLDRGQMDAVMEELLKIVEANPQIIIAQGLPGEKHSISFLAKGKNKKTIAVPEPNPVLIYLRIAFDNIQVAKEKFTIYNDAENNVKDKYEKLNEFLERAIISTVFLITTIEAFINQLIPDDIKLNIKGKKLNKTGLEWTDIITKIEEILPKLGYIDFSKTHSEEYLKICALKKIRNNLTHLKKQTEENKTSYQQLLISILQINFDEYTVPIRTFLNTISPDFVEET